APGPVRTPFWTAPGAFADQAAAAAGTTAQEALDGVVPRSMGISTGRITEPEEGAALIAFLASPVAGNATGAEFTLDGAQVRATGRRAGTGKQGRPTPSHESAAPSQGSPPR